MTTKTLHWTPSGTLTDLDRTPVATISNHDVPDLASKWNESHHSSTLIVPCGVHIAIEAEPSAELLSMWSQDSWEPFNTAILTLTDLAQEHSTELVVLPGAGGRLSDAICTLSWSSTHPEIPLLIDPAGWLTPSMMRNTEDHLIRFASLCRELPNLWGVVVRSVQHGPNDSLIPARLGAGLIDPGLLERTIGSIPTPRRIELSETTLGNESPSLWRAST